MIEIGIIGYDELGKQIEHLIKGSFENIKFYFFDDFASRNGFSNSYSFYSFTEQSFEKLNFLIGLGYKQFEKKDEVLKILDQFDRKLYTYIHPTAYIDKTAIIMDGSIIYPNVTIDKNVRIGRSCIVNLSSTISHDTIIDECSYISPSVTLSGFVRIGKRVFIGAGSCVSNGIEIDDSAVIGIGSVITKNVGNGVNVIGNPQRIIKKINLK